MEETLRTLIAFGLTLLLVMLRFEAQRFGTAEYDEATDDGRWPALKWRLAWYGLGLLGIFAVWSVHPAPEHDLRLVLGNDRLRAIFGGLAFGSIGTAQAIAFAWLRYRHFRLPAISSYPGALINSLTTAFIDEAVFRGMLLGFLVLAGRDLFAFDVATANVIQALVYGLATRLGAPGRDRYMLVLALLIGLGSGWLTLATGGIGAAFLGHAITRFAIFLCTGHAGQVAPPGREIEDSWLYRRPPAGWRIVSREAGGHDR